MVTVRYTWRVNVTVRRWFSCSCVTDVISISRLNQVCTENAEHTLRKIQYRSEWSISWLEKYFSNDWKIFTLALWWYLFTLVLQKYFGSPSGTDFEICCYHLKGINFLYSKECASSWIFFKNSHNFQKIKLQWSLILWLLCLMLVLTTALKG